MIGYFYKGETALLYVRDAIPSDLPSMLDIYNDAIINLTATFDVVEQTLAERMIWFESHGGKYPLLTAELDGEVVGYACLSRFREKPAYDKSTELSIYISSKHRGHGIGTALMQEILQRAVELGYHTVIGGITGGNEVSIKLHKKFGFELAGCFKEVGSKFGQWLDVHFYQLML
jgi:phosphinothricin acetyltransferase